MSYIQVNIGRNIDDAPMNHKVWDSFINDVQDTLADIAAHYSEVDGPIWEACRKRVELHFGQGSWDGIAEESAHLPIFMEVSANEHQINCLKTDMGQIRRKYQQDSIGLVTGSVLV